MKIFLVLGITCLLAVLSTSVMAGDNGDVVSEGGSNNLSGSGTEFACGPDLTCDSRTQYCFVVIGGPEGVAPGYSCVALPSVTTHVSCESIDIGMGCTCTDSDGSITVTCTAP